MEDIGIKRWWVLGPGVPAGVVLRLLQCGAMVTCSSSSVRFIRLFTSALVLASGVLLLRCMLFTSWKNFSLLVQIHNVTGGFILKWCPLLVMLTYFKSTYLNPRTTFSKSLKSRGTSFREQSSSSSLILFWQTNKQIYQEYDIHLSW